jgi:hypothetical protein
MKNIFLTGLLCTVLLFSPFAVQATSVSDHDDLFLALDLWLDGKDLEALAALRDLSNEGNLVAQIFLGKIAERSFLRAQLTQHGLNNKEIRELTRNMETNSTFGTPWIKVAAERDQFAKLFAERNFENDPGNRMSLEKMRKRFQIALQFLDANEPNAATIELYFIVRNLYFLDPEKFPEHYEKIDFLVSKIITETRSLPKEFAPLVFDLLSKLDKAGRPVKTAPIQFVNWFNNNWTEDSGGIFWNTFSGRSGLPKADYTNVRLWTPIRNFCEKKCPNEIAECTAQGGARIAWQSAKTPGSFHLTSPLQSVISDEVYWASPRVNRDLAYAFFDQNNSSLSGNDNCFVKALQDLQATVDADR